MDGLNDETEYLRQWLHDHAGKYVLMYCGSGHTWMAWMPRRGQRVSLNGLATRCPFESLHRGNPAEVERWRTALPDRMGAVQAAALLGGSQAIRDMWDLYWAGQWRAMFAKLDGAR